MIVRRAWRYPLARMRLDVSMVLGALVLVMAVPGCPRSPRPEPPAAAPEPSPKTAFERL